jgi:class 3 adenylate cyclase/tetratricopeptide (TPR) repeat protein
MAVTCPSCGSENPPAAKFCSECATQLAPTPSSAESRRTVTILFADVSGSTSLGEQLDPESLRALMQRYFGVMQSIIESHGGTVEKFIGDAVMAVFGIPRLHEDDALRAVRAAADIVQRLSELNADLEAQQGIAIQFRIGVNTGEVVAGDPATSKTLITGDAVNTAARLEQAAVPGETVIGNLTYALVRDAVQVESIAPLQLKGKAQPVPAYRLLSVSPGGTGHARRLDSLLVGRDPEMSSLRAAFDSVVAERRPGLVTVLGSAGVGKSRLLAEFGATLTSEARWLVGRCLPYGEGITYWPIAEVVRAAAGIEEGDDREAALARLRSLTTESGSMVAERVAQAIGLAAGSAPAEEIFWSIRNLLETLARSQPVVVEFDDIQWGDDVFLDLLEHVLTLANDAPLLLLCPARPELMERRPSWGSGWPGAVTLRLEPLAVDAATELMDGLPGGDALPDSLRTRILGAAAGNPLFVEEMLGMLIDDGLLKQAEDGTWAASGELAEVRLPPTIAALLAARLDQLAPGERGLAERASVIGQSFEQAALAELLPSPDRGGLSRDLMSLVRKELIGPDRAVLTIGDAYRFRHLLIRDAAYEALPKTERADLHARFGDWLEQISGDRLHEYEEIVGYHLEQAHRYRKELGLLDATTAALGDRAAARLTAAGRRAVFGSGSGAAINLLERASALRSEPSSQRWDTLITLGEALTAAGRLAEAQAVLEQALSGATAAATEPVILARADVSLKRVTQQTQPLTMDSAHEADLERDAAILVDAGRHRDAALAYLTLIQASLTHGAFADANRRMDAGIEQAELGGDRYLAGRILVSRAELYRDGPMDVPRATEAIEAMLPETEEGGMARAGILGCLVDLYSMTGRFEDARSAAREARAMLIESGRPLHAVWVSFASAPNERLAGNLEEAERQLRSDYATLVAAGEQSMRMGMACLLAHVLCDRGAFDEALAFTKEAEAMAAADDFQIQISFRSARARSLVERDPETALEIAREAVARAADAPTPLEYGTALLSLAEASEATGRWADADDAASKAASVFEAKGATAYVELAVRRREGIRTRSQLPSS